MSELSQEEPIINDLSEVKLKLKSPIINYDKNPIKDTSNINKLVQENPQLSQEQLIKKCPDVPLM